LLVMVAVAAPNVPDAEPDGTVTDAGTLRRALLLESEIAAPPLGAAADKVTVQVVLTPEARLDGEHVSELTTTGDRRDRVVDCELPP
jgi:hypothetical protein